MTSGTRRTAYDHRMRYGVLLLAAALVGCGAPATTATIEPGPDAAQVATVTAEVAIEVQSLI